MKGYRENIKRLTCGSLALKTTYKKLIVDKVFSIANPKTKWQIDDIKSARRVGKANGNNDRLIIMSFRFDDNKSKIYEGRDKLREKGVRVSDDLTRKQRQSLDKLRRDGRYGYFYKGNFVVLDKDLDANSSSGERKNRTFKKLRVSCRQRT